MVAGPTKEQQIAGYFRARFAGVTAEPDGAAPQVVTAEMYGDRDPGYGWTSRAVLEAGLCLALQVCGRQSEISKAGVQHLKP